MTIDEAIANAREVAERNRILLDSDELVQKSYDAHFDKLKCEKCAEKHEQLAEWLEELKMYRESSYGELYGMVYSKAIDDFKSMLEERILAGKMIDEKFAYIDNCDIDEIAEQLKEGVKE